MTNQQLYIDGELVDLGEDTTITLSIKSNLFREISDIVSNNTYTIKLPKTVRNQRIIGHADLVQNGGSTYPYAYHTAQYFRGGVQLIKNGRAAVMSVGEDIELSIIWGLYPALQKVIDDNVTINGLSNDTYIATEQYHTPDKYEVAVQRGYFWPFYNSLLLQSDYDWSSTSGSLEANNINKVTFSVGLFPVAMLWETCTFQPDTDKTDYRHAVIRVNVGDTVGILTAQSGDEAPLWAFLDEGGNVIRMSGSGLSVSGTQSLELVPGYDVSYIVINALSLPAPDVKVNRRSFVYHYNPIGVELWKELNYDTKIRFTRPAVTLPWLLGKIRAELGVAFNWDGEAKSLIDSLAIPILSNEADEKTFKDSIVELVFPAMTDYGQMPVIVRRGGILFDVSENAVTSLTAKSGGTFYVDAIANWLRTVSDLEEGAIPDTYIYWDCVMTIKVTGTDGNSNEYQIGNDGPAVAYSDQISSGFINVAYSGAGKIEFEQGDVVTFELKNGGNPNMPHGSAYSMGITATPYGDNEVPVGGQFPVVMNLPDIEVIELVKFLCAITGTFPRQVDSAGSVNFASFDSVWDFSMAIDWTGKLVAKDADNKPREMEYTMDGYAQKTWYKWKEDETVKGNYDGCISISNQLLDASTDAYEFPFAASDGNIIPIVSWDSHKAGYSDNDFEEVDCEPRIMRLVDNYGRADLRFDFDMQKIINSKYKNLAASLQQAKVIKETMLLSDIEIMEFDETRPVYLAQYGAYFAVTEIEANDDGTSDVTMLQIRKSGE